MRINKSRTPVLDARFRNSNERIVGNNGELNAGSTQELMQRMLEVAQMIQAGEVAAAEDNSVETAAQQRQAFNEAYHDDKQWAELGSAIAMEIDTRVEREGFLRTFLERAEVAQGAVPRFKIREPNVRAVLARGPAQIYPQFVRDKYITAEEFNVVANPRVEELELNQGSANMLEDKYFEGMEAILVQEDKTMVSLFDASVGVYNDIAYFSSLTPSIVQLAKYNIERWRLPAAHMLLSIDLMNDMVTGTDFSTYFDPVSKYEVIMTGRIGRIFGMEIITDGFREPTLQVMDPGTLYISSVPNMTGGYTDRGPVNSRPVDMHDAHVPARGWSMWEIISMVLANGKAVSKAKRS